MHTVRSLLLVVGLAALPVGGAAAGTVAHHHKFCAPQGVTASGACRNRDHAKVSAAPLPANRAHEMTTGSGRGAHTIGHAGGPGGAANR